VKTNEREKEFLDTATFWNFIEEAYELQARFRKWVSPYRILRLVTPDLAHDLYLIADEMKRRDKVLLSLPIGDRDFQEEIRCRFLSELKSKLEEREKELEGDQAKAIDSLIRLVENRLMRGGGND
jgi:hypothetical protein